MRISGLGTPAIVQVQAVGDKNPNHKTPKKQEKPNTEFKSGQVTTSESGLPNLRLDVSTILSIEGLKNNLPDPLVAIQSYENMKNK